MSAGPVPKVDMTLPTETGYFEEADNPLLSENVLWRGVASSLSTPTQGPRAYPIPAGQNGCQVLRTPDVAVRAKVFFGVFEDLEKVGIGLDERLAQSDRASVWKVHVAGVNAALTGRIIGDE